MESQHKAFTHSPSDKYAITTSEPAILPTNCYLCLSRLLTCRG